MQRYDVYWRFRCSMLWRRSYVISQYTCHRYIDACQMFLWLWKKRRNYDVCQHKVHQQRTAQRGDKHSLPFVKVFYKYTARGGALWDVTVNYELSLQHFFDAPRIPIPTEGKLETKQSNKPTSDVNHTQAVNRLRKLLLATWILASIYLLGAVRANTSLSLVKVVGIQLGGATPKVISRKVKCHRLA